MKFFWDKAVKKFEELRLDKVGNNKHNNAGSEHEKGIGSEQDVIADNATLIGKNSGDYTILTIQ